MRQHRPLLICRYWIACYERARTWRACTSKTLLAMLLHGSGPGLPNRAPLPWHPAAPCISKRRPARGPQVTMFEFSNESFNTDYAGKARATDYGWSLGQWAPVLKGMLPSMKIGANGKPGWWTQGYADYALNNGANWWQQARRPCMPLHSGPCACSAAHTAERRTSAPRSTLWPV